MAPAPGHGFCKACNSDVPVEQNEADGFICCTRCGAVLDDAIFSTDATFIKGPGGQAQADGTFVPESGVARALGPRGARGFTFPADSHEKTLQKGKQEITQLVDRLGVRPREDVTAGALRLYQLAVGHSFTRGRRTAHVAGACVYTVCRQDGRPYMLIDVADALQANVYTLGAVVLQLARLLRMDAPASGASAGAGGGQAPGAATGLAAALPVDPSLYIHRFADKLNLGSHTTAVAHTALRLVAAMRRDWLQTGRRPAGVCGAALFVAAAVHGCARDKEAIMAVVHVGQTTLRKRLLEFEGTIAGGLTPGEFDAHAAALEVADASTPALPSPAPGSASGAPAGLLTCAHANQPGAVFAAHGMCQVCFAQYRRACAGHDEGGNPPAFERAQQLERMSSGAVIVAEPQQAPSMATAPGAGAGADAEARVEMETALAEDTMRYALSHGGALPPGTSAQAAQQTGGGGAPLLALPPPAGAPASTPVAAGAPRATPQQTPKRTPAKRKPGTAAPPGAQKRGAITAAVIARAAAAHGGAHATAGPLPSVQPWNMPSLEVRSLTAMRELVGAEVVQNVCLPLGPEGTFAGRVSVFHLQDGHPQAGTAATRLGAHVRRVPPQEMAYLLAAGAFDDSALAFLHRYASHDLSATLARARRGSGAGALESQLPAAEEDDFSDVDDEDVDTYIHSSEEAELKSLIWSELHKEYVQAAEARQAAAAQAQHLLPAAAVDDGGAHDEEGAAGGRAKKKSRGAALHTTTPAGAAADGVAGGAVAPPESAAEATRDMLARKKLSSKINYEALSTLFAQQDDDHADEDDPAGRNAGGAPGEGRLFGARLGAPGSGRAPGMALPPPPFGNPGPSSVLRRGGTASGLGNVRPAGAPGSLLAGGTSGRLASVALPTSSLGGGLSGLPQRRGLSLAGDARITASAATSLGNTLGAAGGGGGGTSRPRQAPQQ